MSQDSSVIVVVADGLRPDTLRRAMDSGEAPALRELAAQGGTFDITTVFPSVTGLAYTPFLSGRHPASIGLTGLRWFDRSRRHLSFPTYTRSYMGYQIRHVDTDMHAGVPTMFELVRPSLGAMTMVGRGLSRRDWLGRGFMMQLRGATTHYRASLSGWLQMDRDIADAAVERIASEDPRFALIALLGIDKASHSEGQDGPLARQALGIVDDTVARLRESARRSGRDEAQRIWVVSDHGHSPVKWHEDLAGFVAVQGHRVIAHPWIYSVRPAQVAVMVSGNAMAHIYVELSHRSAPGWKQLSSRWETLAEALLHLESVDLLMLPDGNRCVVRARGRGEAVVKWSNGTYSYHTSNGDPLGIGDCDSLDEHDAYSATIASDYPDALVQIARLAGADRSGDIILSAARDWDFRARYEPIPHRSSHGALHREHMLVPLILDRPPSSTPRRSVEIMASAAEALGIPIPAGVEGPSFL